MQGVTMVLPGSTSQYDFTYDDQDNLRRLTLPSGQSYNIKKMVGVGFIRTSVSGPSGSTLYTEDRGDSGNILAFMYPGMYDFYVCVCVCVCVYVQYRGY